MKALSSVEIPQSQRPLWVSAFVAFALEFIFLTAVAWHQHWLAHPQATTGLDSSKFIEAQVFEMPEKAQLTSKGASVKIAPEAELSKVVGQGKKAKPGEGKLQEENVTHPSPPATPAAATHGPVAVFTPAPVLPSYLQDQDRSTAVVIEFFVTAQGGVIPKLLRSSGNEELDAIALQTANRWQFRPAEQDHKAIDAKVRLRIVFEAR
jgi:TonB family protein